jgi:hypothetical protein
MVFGFRVIVSAKTDPHPCVFRSHPCERVDTPTAAPSGHPALRVRGRRPGFADGTSCACGERARIVRAPLRADPSGAHRR